MDFAGAKLLFAIILIILIVFAGTVPPAYRNILDTWYGRIAIALAILIIAKQAGWWLGILATIAVLVLMPMSMREGFMNQEGFRGGGGEGGSRGGVLETAADKVYFADYKRKDGFRGGVLETAADKDYFENKEEEEKLSSIEEPFMRQEGFWAGSDKKQKVPKERRRQWFIEEVMDEHPETIETDTVETQAVQ